MYCFPGIKATSKQEARNRHRWAPHHTIPSLVIWHQMLRQPDTSGLLSLNHSCQTLKLVGAQMFVLFMLILIYILMLEFSHFHNFFDLSTIASLEQIHHLPQYWLVTPNTWKLDVNASGICNIWSKLQSSACVSACPKVSFMTSARSAYSIINTHFHSLKALKIQMQLNVLWEIMLIPLYGDFPI